MISIYFVFVEVGGIDTVSILRVLLIPSCEEIGFSVGIS